ncbi:MAG: hypothetical protein IJ196_03750 [Prevotella sp.]|nr:hypothetical protein [Prevotella sp.]
MKTKALLFVLLTLSVFQVHAQNKEEVTLIVSADGANKEEATKVALRSAIEQAYGTFVSSKTEILNDELVKDEVITLSFGNIKSFKELSSEVLPDGKIFTTLHTTVSIPQLVSYAKSKGAEVEFAGTTFAMNLKIEELNKRNEEKIVANMLFAMEKLYMTGFEYKINVTNPKANGEMIAEIDVVANDNAIKARELFYSTLEKISLNKEKIKEFQELGKEVYGIGFYPVSSSKVSYGYRSNKYKRTEEYTFRSENTLKSLSEFFNFTYPKAILNVRIDTDTETSRIELISSYGWVFSSSGFGEKNKGRYGNEIDNKRIFDQSIPAYESFLTKDANAGVTNYTRYYVAKDRILNYIQSVEDIENFCYFSFCEDVAAYQIKDKAFIAGYPIHKLGNPLHHIKLTLLIPQDDLMKISKFTITRNNE